MARARRGRRCSPATVRTPPRVWGDDTHFRDKAAQTVTLPQRLNEAGWHTQAFGKILRGKVSNDPSWSPPAWPEGGRQAGMQSVDEKRFAQMRAADAPDNALLDGQVADHAIEAMRQLKDHRFFLAVGFQTPHLPCSASIK